MSKRRQDLDQSSSKKARVNPIEEEEDDAERRTPSPQPAPILRDILLSPRRPFPPPDQFIPVCGPVPNDKCR